jgi:hypothetical protein
MYADHLKIDIWTNRRIARGQFHCPHFYQQANTIITSAILLTGQMQMLQIGLEVYMIIDIVLLLPQHGNQSSFQHGRVFVDIFATKGSEQSTDRTFQPTLKIRRLGPLVHIGREERDRKAVWVTNESVEMCVF